MLLSSFLLLNSAGAATTYDATNFSADGRKWQPIPTGHTPGKDNGPGTGTHNLGEDCGICHKPNGKAPTHIFTMSGTLYEDRAARKTIKGGEVILQDINGKVISMTSNEVGNFWTYTAIGGNPLTVVGKGAGFKMYSTDTVGAVVKYADTTYPQTWQYKTWVKNGDHVLPMVTIAPVGGATILSDGKPDPNSRMSCSMHHSPMGSRGALWASTKNTLKSYPATGLSFKKHISPIFMNKCVPCHIPGSTVTRIVTKSDIVTTFPNTTTTWVDYSNKHDLTSWADTTSEGKKGVSHYATGYSSANADSSPLLIKTKVNGSNHAGGWFWNTTDNDYKAIKQWIVEGAQNN